MDLSSVKTGNDASCVNLDKLPIYKVQRIENSKDLLWIKTGNDISDHLGGNHIMKCIGRNLCILTAVKAKATFWLKLY